MVGQVVCIYEIRRFRISATLYIHDIHHFLQKASLDRH